MWQIWYEKKLRFLISSIFFFSQNATVSGNISKPFFLKKSIFWFLTNIDRLCVGLMVKVTVEKRPATPDINLERAAQFKNRSKFLMNLVRRSTYSSFLYFQTFLWWFRPKLITEMRAHVRFQETKSVRAQSLDCRF